MNSFITVVLALFSTIIVAEYYRVFYNEKASRQIISIVYICYFIWQILSVITINAIHPLARLVISILMVLLVGLLYDGVIIGKIALTIIFISLWLLCEVLTGCIYIVTLNIAEYYENVCSAISKLLFFIIIEFVRRFVKNNLENRLSWKQNIIIMLFPLGSIFVAYHVFSMSNVIKKSSFTVMSFFILACLFGMNYTMLYIYNTLIESIETLHEKELYQLEIELLYDNMKERENSIAQVRKIRHDMKHDLLFAIERLEEGKYIELEKHLKQLLDIQNNEYKTIANTGNPLVDTIVNYKYEIAKEKDIDFKVNLDIPTYMALDEPELCVILGNSLDNAIEACVRGNVKNPLINLKMKYDTNNLIIILENTFDGKINEDSKGNIKSRKKQKEEHGFGITSIKQSVEKYHGFYDVEINEDKYRLKMILYAQDTEFSNT